MMYRNIYCDYFCCEYYQEGKCTSPELHLGFHGPCVECKFSEEHLEKYLEEQKAKPQGQSKDYGKATLQPKVYPLRQESEKISKE